MDEYVMPSLYTGDGFGLAVCFDGLEDDEYDSLALSIDGAHFFDVERDTGEPCRSVPHSFGGLNPGEIYCVTGRVASGGVQSLVSCLMPASERLPKTKRRKAAVYMSGGMPAPPVFPKAGEK